MWGEVAGCTAAQKPIFTRAGWRVDWKGVCVPLMMAVPYLYVLLTCASAARTTAVCQGWCWCAGNASMNHVLLATLVLGLVQYRLVYHWQGGTPRMTTGVVARCVLSLDGHQSCGPLLSAFSRFRTGRRPEFRVQTMYVPTCG